MHIVVSNFVFMNFVLYVCVVFSIFYLCEFVVFVCLFSKGRERRDVEFVGWEGGGNLGGVVGRKTVTRTYEKKNQLNQNLNLKLFMINNV